MAKGRNFCLPLGYPPGRKEKLDFQNLAKKSVVLACGGHGVKLA